MSQHKKQGKALVLKVYVDNSLFERQLFNFESRLAELAAQFGKQSGLEVELKCLNRFIDVGLADDVSAAFTNRANVFVKRFRPVLNVEALTAAIRARDLK